MVATKYMLLLLLGSLYQTVVSHRQPKNGSIIAFLTVYPNAVPGMFQVIRDQCNTATKTRQPQSYRNAARLSAFEPDEVEKIEKVAVPDTKSGRCPDFDLDTLVDEFTYEGNASLKNHIDTRLSKLRFIHNEMETDPYPEVPSTETVTDISDIIAKHSGIHNGEDLTDTNYRIYGRIASLRFDGQFVVLQDSKGNRLQVMFKRKENVQIGEKQITGDKISQLIDTGDVIGAEGYIKKTSTGELTLVARSISIAAKCLLPPPDPFHGLKEVATRFRLRHVDIMTNRETRELLLQRSKMIWHLRQLLHSRGFTEVETPILNYGYSGADAKPFSTTSNALGEKLYMRIAPEFFLKRLITGGLSDKIFEIGKCFRNEGTSTQHSPEFTMVEIYQQLADMKDMMRLTEEIIASVAEHLGGDLRIAIKWNTKTMRELIQEYGHVDIENLDREGLLFNLEKDGVNIEELTTASWGELACELFKSRVQNQLIAPTHVTHLPSDVSPLADGSGKYTQVFESYIGSMEIAHGCTEECNPLELISKLNNCNKRSSSPSRDKEFMNALAHGMPPTAGLGIGLDRLLMAITGTPNIKSTQTFPLLRSV